MLRKTIDKKERNKRRLPPIPYTRKGKTKKDVLNRILNKYKERT